MTSDGALLVSCDETRSQETNKQRALNRLAAWIRTALLPDKPRISTKPTFGSQRRRLEQKKKRAGLKAGRTRCFSDHDD
jgi:ribosome-associated protein